MTKELIFACDIGDFSHVQTLLENYFNIPPLILEQSFRLAISHQNLDIIRLFLMSPAIPVSPGISSTSTISCKKTKLSILELEFIDRIFHEQFMKGSSPNLLLLLQEYCSTGMLAETYRSYQKLKKKSSYYLVNPTEVEQWKSTFSFLCNPLPHKISKKNADLLRHQVKMNNALLDAGFCNWRYITSHMLVKTNRFLPSQATINELFLNVLVEDNYTFAELLIQEDGDGIEEGKKRLTVNQQGINDAFLQLLSQGDSSFDALEWFLLNQCGIRPDQEIIENGYRELKTYQNRLSHNNPRTINFFDLPGARQGFGNAIGDAFRVGHGRAGFQMPGLGLGRAVAVQGRKSREKQQERHQELLKNFSSLLTLVSLYVRDEVIEEMTEKIKQVNEKEQRRLQVQQRLRHGATPEIHSYSSVMVRGENGEGDMMMDGNQHDGMNGFDEEMLIDDGDEEGNAMELVEEHHDHDVPHVQPFPRNHPLPHVVPGGAVATPGRNNIHQRRTINNLIYSHMKERVGMELVYTQDNVISELTILIERYLPSSQHEEAISRIGDLLNRQSIPNFGLTLTFLRMFHPESLGLWIIGFLGESIVVGSCTPGAMERIVTGLRGLGDSELDAIFSHAEGPQLFRIFLSTLNIFDSNPIIQQRNLNNLIHLLLEKGITEFSSLNEVKEQLFIYISEMKENYNIPTTSSSDNGDDRSSTRNESDSIIEVLIDCYDDEIKPELVRKRQEQCLTQQEQQQSSSSSSSSSTSVSKMDT
jgi:hypothetical protein